MNAHTRLRDLRVRHGGMLTPSMIPDTLTRALLWKQYRWAAEEICEDWGWGSFPEWNNETFRIAYDQWIDAKLGHAHLIQSMWTTRAMLRGYVPARKIVTSCQYPPIPTRDHDWCAYYEGEEEAGGYGWGATEEEAIADFVENCADDEPAPRVRLVREVAA